MVDQLGYSDSPRGRDYLIGIQVQVRGFHRTTVFCSFWPFNRSPHWFSCIDSKSDPTIQPYGSLLPILRAQVGQEVSVTIPGNTISGPLYHDYLWIYACRSEIMCMGSSTSSPAGMWLNVVKTHYPTAYVGTTIKTNTIYLNAMNAQPSLSQSRTPFRATLLRESSSTTAEEYHWFRQGLRHGS